jgi:hypothetical protein
MNILGIDFEEWFHPGTSIDSSVKIAILSLSNKYLIHFYNLG